jgi:lipopolysaccharide biosynthesis regulator YciM
MKSSRIGKATDITDRINPKPFKSVFPDHAPTKSHLTAKIEYTVINQFIRGYRHVSFRLIIAFAFFTLLTLYFTFLNPGDIEIHLTQNTSFPIPIPVFLLLSVLIGILLTSLFTGYSQIKNAFKRFLITRSWKNKTRQQKQWEKWYQKAENALKGGHQDRALSLFNKILNGNPDHIASLIQLGNLYRKMGKTTQAIEAHQKAVNADRDSPQALQCLAEDFATAGQLNKAIETLKQARHLEPDSLFTLRKLREAYRKQNSWNRVLQIQKSILSHVSNAKELEQEKEYSSQIAYLRGCELISQQHLEPAISELKRAIKENPKSLPPYIKLGDLYQQNGNSKAAIKAWKSGLEITGSHISLLRLRAAYEQAEQPDQMIKLYQEAIRASQNSKKETLVLTLAGLYLDQGKMEEAMQTLWSIASPSIPAHLLLIKAHQDKHESDKADQVICAALKKLETSLSKFVCRQCNSEFDQWSGICPECQAWDSLDSALQHTL